MSEQSLSLTTMHTACVRLRDALDRWLAAFEVLAHEAAVHQAPPVPAAHRGGSGYVGDATRRLIELAALPGGVTAVSAVPAPQALGLTANTSAACSRLDQLTKRGVLVRASASGQRNHYFTSQTDADGWLAQFGPPPLDTPDSADVATGLSALSAATSVAVRTPSVRPSTPMDAVHSRQPQQLAAMVEADAPAVAKALAVIAPQPAPSAPPPQLYIPPTPSRARGERREQLAAAAYVAPVAKPEGEVIVPPTAKITKAPTPFDGRFTVDPKLVGQDPESFSAQWARLRGGSTA